MTAAARARRVIVAAFSERLPYKAAALLFALVLWLVVHFDGAVQAR